MDRLDPTFPSLRVPPFLPDGSQLEVPPFLPPDHSQLEAPSFLPHSRVELEQEVIRLRILNAELMNENEDLKAQCEALR